MAGATERAFVPAPLATAGGRVIVSPFQFVADADTFLRVTSVCSVTGVTIAVQGRRLDDQGALQPIRETHAPNSNRVVKTQDYGLGVGAILNLTVFASAGAPLAGQCYVMVQLLRNFGGTAIVLGTLLGGYVTATQALGFPGSPIVSSTDGEPASRVITGTSPALGVELLETVPPGARWELLSMWFQLNTAAGGVNRRVTIKVDNGSSVFCQVLAFNVSGPSTLWTHCWGPGVEGTSDAALLLQQAGIPGRIIIPTGGRFFTSTANLAAGDQFSGLVYLVREWLEVN